MKITSVLVLALSALVASGVAQSDTKLTPKQIYQKYKDSVVSIETKTAEGDFTGSGFFYQNRHTVVTCYHVIRGAKEITIKGTDGVAWTPKSVTANKDNDTALLILTRDTDREPLLPAPYEGVDVGDPVCVIGDPLGLKSSLSTGVVGAKRAVRKVSLIQLTAPISEGSSGSPLIDELGRAIGFVSFTFTEGQNLNMAVSSGELEKTAKASPEVPLEDFLQASQKEQATDAGKQFNTVLAEFCGASWESSLRWEILWDDYYHLRITDTKKLDEAYHAFLEVVDNEDLQKKIHSAIAGADENETKSTADLIADLKKLASTLHDAEFAAARVSDNDKEFEKALTSVSGARWNLTQAFSTWLEAVAKGKLFAADVFMDGLPDSMIGNMVLQRADGLVDPEHEEKVIVRVTYRGSKFKPGDVVIGVRTSDSSTFTPVSDLHGFRQWINSHEVDGITLRVQRNGKEVNVLLPKKTKSK